MTSDSEDMPMTKRDLREALNDLKQFLHKREIVAIRWSIGIFGALLVTYFFGVWFMVSHLNR